MLFAHCGGRTQFPAAPLRKTDCGCGPCLVNGCVVKEVIRLALGSRCDGGGRGSLRGLGRTLCSCDCQSDSCLNSKNLDKVCVCNQ